MSFRAAQPRGICFSLQAKSRSFAPLRMTLWLSPYFATPSQPLTVSMSASPSVPALDLSLSRAAA